MTDLKFRSMDGRTIPYLPLVIRLRAAPYLLALHRDKEGDEWQISNPNTGHFICNANSYHAGRAHPSSRLNAIKARIYGRRTLEDLRKAVGDDWFSEMVLQGQTLLPA